MCNHHNCHADPVEPKNFMEGPVLRKRRGYFSKSGRAY